MPVWRTLFGATLLKSILHLGLLSSKLNILIQQMKMVEGVGGFRGEREREKER